MDRRGPCRCTIASSSPSTVDLYIYYTRSPNTEESLAIFDKDMPPPPWRSYIRLAFLFHSVDFTMICLSITLSENDDIVIRTPCFPPRPHRRIAVCYHAVHSIASCQERICIDFGVYSKVTTSKSYGKNGLCWLSKLVKRQNSTRHSIRSLYAANPWKTRPDLLPDYRNVILANDTEAS